MKYFMFVGDPSSYTWRPKPVRGKVYGEYEDLNGFLSLHHTLQMAREQDQNDPFLKDWLELENYKDLEEINSLRIKHGFPIIK